MDGEKCLSRREWLRWLGGSSIAGWLVGSGTTAVALSGLTYRESLEEALVAMEQGNHTQALNPLKSALTLDRTEPCGLLTLGTLYLHTGSVTRAAREFQRVRRFAPSDGLAAWGNTLIALIQGETPDFSVLPAEIPEELVLLLQEYLVLTGGNAKAVKAATSYVEATEPNPLRLEIAAFAALRGGDAERGEALLKALLARKEMRVLAEDRAVLLPFVTDPLLQPGAPTLPTALGMPEPTLPYALSGSVSLVPPQPLPRNASFVAYRVDGGGGYAATTNQPPFTSEWNSARYPNGLYTVRATVFDDGGRELRTATRAVVVSNPNAPASRSLTPAQRKAFRERLLKLLTPRPTRKAAHFALAKQAAERNEEATALYHIESVVAIDPLYQNARSSLRRYNREVVGDYEGIWCGVTEEKIVALTFDDGPHPTRTGPLLDALAKENAVATFFVVGIRAEASPELLVRMDEGGHEIANHSYSHPNLTFLPRPGIERELCRTSCIVRDTIGKRPRFYRPPGGNANRTVSETAELLGMAGAFWTVDGHKFENPPFTPQRLTQYVVGKVRPGAIVLLHNAPDNTVAAVPTIIRSLRARGYRLVTMSELLRVARPGNAATARVIPAKMKE